MGAATHSLKFDDLIAPFGFMPDDALAVAVSGGPDSMALLLLAAEEARRSGRKLHALTVDHGLRAAAKDEAAQVAGWARALGVPHTILSWDGDVPRADIQAQARGIRYALMGEWCRDNKMAALLVAHTRDDQAETFLLRLGRGSGVDGLAAMSPDVMRDGLRIARPLLNVPRAALLGVLAQGGQDFVTDPSNADTRHARVRMRALAPALEAEGLTAQRLAETAMRMATARDALEGWTRSHLARAAVFHAGGYGYVDRDILLEAPQEIRLRALARLVVAVTGNKYPPRLHHTRALLARLEDAAFSGATLAGARIAAHGGRLLFFREARAINASVPLGGMTPILWDGRFELVGPRGGLDAIVGPLGAKGWRQVRDQVPQLSIPAAVGACLPALYAGEKLVEVPHLGVRTDGGEALFAAAFVGPMRAGLVAAPILADISTQP